MTTQTHVVLKAYGAASAVQATATAVGRGEISAQDVPKIVEAARLQSGEIDPKAIAAVEQLAQQMASLARAMKSAAQRDAMPAVRLEAFPIAWGKLPEAVAEAAFDGYGMTMPIGGGLSPRIRGAKENAQGGYDVLIGTVNITDTEVPATAQHHLVTVSASGEPSQAREVRVIA